MTAINIILKISALLAIIIIPLVGPRKKKKAAPVKLSAFSVNEEGFLEHFKGNPMDHHPVN
jgi:hypothetical protein